MARKKGAQKGECGVPRHVPTDEQRRLVKALRAYGNSDAQIAILADISEATLYRHYRAELDKGSLEANSKVAETLYRKALSGDNSSMQYWLSRRAGWKETTTHEHKIVPTVIHDDIPE